MIPTYNQMIHVHKKLLITSVISLVIGLVIGGVLLRDNIFFKQVKTSIDPGSSYQETISNCESWPNDFEGTLQTKARYIDWQKDGSAGISSYHVAKNGFVYGEVLNSSDEDVYGTQVTLTLYRSDGSEIESTSKYVSLSLIRDKLENVRLSSKQEASFQIPFKTPCFAKYSLDVAASPYKTFEMFYYNKAAEEWKLEGFTDELYEHKMFTENF